MALYSNWLRVGSKYYAEARPSTPRLCEWLVEQGFVPAAVPVRGQIERDGDEWSARVYVIPKRVAEDGDHAVMLDERHPIVSEPPAELEVPGWKCAL